MARSDKAVAKASVLMLLDNKSFNRAVKDTRKSWEGLVRNISNINKTYFNNSAFGQGLTEAMSKITGPVSKMGPYLKAAGGAIMQIGQAALTAGGVLGGAFVAGLGASVKAAAALEDEALGLKMIMGEGPGQEMTDYIRSFYPSTSGSRSVFMQAAQDLSRLGMQAPAIKEMLQAMGDAGALSRLGTDAGVQNLTEAFKTINAEGKLTTRTIRQFRAVGIDFYGILAEQLGSVEAAQKAVSDGSISAAMAQQLFLSYMSQYYGAMQQYSNTASGTLGTIKAQITELAVGIGQQYLPLLKEVGGYVQDFLTYCMNNLPNLQALINDIIAWAIEHINELAGNIAHLADNIRGVLTTLRELVTGHWRFTESRQLAGDIVEAEQSGNYISTRAKQMAKGGGLTDILKSRGFAPDQIAAGMAAARAQRAARDLQYTQNAGNIAAGTRAFTDTRMQQDMLDQLQQINDNISSIKGQNTAGVNAAIPIKGGYAY